MRRLFLPAILALSIISTSLPVWGEAGEVDRRPLVTQMYRQMPGFLDFLYGSEAFRKALSGGEARILGGILALFAEAQWQRSPEIEIEFSSARDSFKLGGQERTAMTSVLREDPILFNEALIQSPSFRFEMLDALQLLVHELARKIPNVNMDDAESLAVKVRTELETYAQTIPLGDHDRLVTLTPPMAIQPVRFGVSRVMPLVMIESWGKYLYAPLKFEFLTAPLKSVFVDHESLSAAGYPSGNFQSVISYRVAMPMVKPAERNSFEISMPLLVEENFSVMGTNLELRPLPGSGIMLGQPNRSGIVPVIRSVVDLKWLYSSRSAPGSRESQAYLHPEFPSQPEDFGRDAKGLTADLRIDGAQVSGRIFPAAGIKTAHLVAGKALIPVNVSESGEFKGPVEWPALLDSSRISEMLVNLEAKIPLSQSVSAPVPQAASRKEALDEPEVLVNGQWKPIESLGGVHLPSRLRLRFKTSEPVLQVQLAWTAPRLVFFDNVKAGEVHTKLWQIISRFQPRDGHQEAEILLDGLADWPALAKSRFADSGERVLSEARLVLKNGSLLRYSNFSQTFRDRPFFHIEGCEQSLQTNLSQRKK